MRVLVFGASTAEGFWDSRGGWVDRLKQHYYELYIKKGVRRDPPMVTNLGVAGNTAANVEQRIEAEVTARLKDNQLAIIIQVGTNNAAIRSGQPISTTEQYQQELGAIIKKAKKFTNKIMVVGFPAVNENLTNPVSWADYCYTNESIAKFEAAAAEAASNQAVDFVGVHQEFLLRAPKGQALQADDGLHPNEAGHELIFNLVLPRLDQLLELDN